MLFISTRFYIKIYASCHNMNIIMIRFHSNSVAGVFHIRLYALTLTAACLTPLPGHTDRHPSNNLRAIQSLPHSTISPMQCRMLSTPLRLPRAPVCRQARVYQLGRVRGLGSFPTRGYRPQRPTTSIRWFKTHAGFYHLTASGTFPPSSRGRQTGTVALAKTYVKRAGNQLGTGPLTCFSHSSSVTVLHAANDVAKSKRQRRTIKRCTVPEIILSLTVLLPCYHVRPRLLRNSLLIIHDVQIPQTFLSSLSIHVPIGSLRAMCII